MQELILWAQVPTEKHDIVLSVLAGIAGLQPSPLAERHLLFRPRRQVGAPTERNVLQRAKDLGIPEAFIKTQYYIQAVGNLATLPRAPAKQDTIQSNGQHPETDDTRTAAGDASTNAGSDQQKVGHGGGDDDDLMAVDNENENKTSNQAVDSKIENTHAPVEATPSDWLSFPWTVEFREFPVKPPQSDRAAPGQAIERSRQGLERPSAVATQRAMWNAEVPADMSPLSFLGGLDFGFVSEHLLAGHRLTHKDIDLRLFRVYGVVPASDVGPVSDGPTTITSDSAGASSPIPRIAVDLRALLADGQQPPLQMQMPHALSGSQDDGATAGAGAARQLDAIDASGTYLLQARLAIADSDPKLKKEGEGQMRELADRLRGFVDLRLGGYLQMDTRILTRQDG